MGSGSSMKQKLANQFGLGHDDQVMMTRLKWDDGKSVADIAKQFNIRKNSITKSIKIVEYEISRKAEEFINKAENDPAKAIEFIKNLAEQYDLEITSIIRIFRSRYNNIIIEDLVDGIEKFPDDIDNVLTTVIMLKAPVIDGKSSTEYDVELGLCDPDELDKMVMGIGEEKMKEPEPEKIVEEIVHKTSHYEIYCGRPNARFAKIDEETMKNILHDTLVNKLSTPEIVEKYKDDVKCAAVTLNMIIRKNTDMIKTMSDEEAMSLYGFEQDEMETVRHVLTTGRHYILTAEMRQIKEDDVTKDLLKYRFEFGYSIRKLVQMNNFDGPASSLSSRISTYILKYTKKYVDEYDRYIASGDTTSADKVLAEVANEYGMHIPYVRDVLFVVIRQNGLTNHKGTTLQQMIDNVYNVAAIDIAKKEGGSGTEAIMKTRETLRNNRNGRKNDVHITITDNSKKKREAKEVAPVVVDHELSIEERISILKEEVEKAKLLYDTKVSELKALETEKKENDARILLDQYIASGKSLDDIMEFLKL